MTTLLETKAPDKQNVIAPEKIGDFLYKVADGDEIEMARKFHHDCFLRSGFISESSPTQMIEDQYVEKSTYLIALKVKDRGSSQDEAEIVGVIRQIQQSPMGVPTLNNFEIDSKYKKELSCIPDQEIVEIGSLSSHPQHNVGKGLYRFAWQRSKLLKHSIWLAAIDERLYRVFKAKLFFEFVTIGRPDLYQGSITVPAVLDRATQAKEMPLKAPELWNFFDQAPAR
jgi:hypothetical protein